jgi:hypothetical protein
MTGPVIAAEAGRFYLAPMLSRLLRFLAMIAMLLMPFGMAAAPAAPDIGHHASASMAGEHCPEAPDEQDAGGSVSGCAMPCSAALPAGDETRVDSHPSIPAPLISWLSPAFSSVELEIATPPPKLS